MLRKLGLIIGACAALAIVIQGCGGGEGDDASKPTTTVKGGGAWAATKPEAGKPTKTTKTADPQ